MSTASIPIVERAKTPERRPEAGLAVQAVDLSRMFEDGHQALESVSLAVATGEIHALLGPNGAGKTTLLRILSGLTTPTTGRVEILGLDPSLGGRELRRSVGLIPAGDRTFYNRITGLENLVFFARLHGLRRRVAQERAIEVLERVGLAEAERKRVGEYSSGMVKRLSIARALLAQPRILLVDEATHDLDPSGARAIRELVAGLCEEGVAVVWATQRVEEIQGFAHRVTVLRRGRTRFSGSVSELVSRAASSRYLLRLSGPGGRVPSSRTLAGIVTPLAAIEPVAGPGRDHFLLSLGEPANLAVVLARLLERGIEVLSCRHERPDIEQAFLALTEEAS